jgi:adenosyl cobinamide kinase/adenosyl cobinamide phosphate guanylyltransferase
MRFWKRWRISVPLVLVTNEVGMGLVPNIDGAAFPGYRRNGE